MPLDNELYPRLEAELDAAFRRHHDDQSTPTSQSIADVAQADIEAAQSDSDFSAELRRLNRSLQETRDPYEFENLLIKRSELIDNRLQEDSAEALFAVEKSSAEAELSLNSRPSEHATFTEARAILRQGSEKIPTVLGDIVARAPTNVQPVIRLALNVTFLDQARQILAEGPEYAEDAVRYLELYTTTAGAPESLERRALDAEICNQALQIIRLGAEQEDLAKARDHIKYCTTSGKYFAQMSLDRYIFSYFNDVWFDATNGTSKALPLTYLDNLSGSIRELAKNLFGNDPA